MIAHLLFMFVKCRSLSLSHMRSVSRCVVWCLVVTESSIIHNIIHDELLFMVHSAILHSFCFLFHTWCSLLFAYRSSVCFSGWFVTLYLVLLLPAIRTLSVLIAFLSGFVRAFPFPWASFSSLHFDIAGCCIFSLFLVSAVSYGYREEADHLRSEERRVGKECRL